MRHQNILVVGGGGFIGGHLVATLAKDGRRVTVPTRRRESAKRLILLPTVDVVEADVNDDAVLDRLMAGKDAVINLVGILHGDTGSPYGRAFEAAHVTLPERIVAACRRAGVTRILHMSAIGASANAPSMYLRSKAAGEAVVEEAGTIGDGTTPIATTIFRPSVVFGRDDRFMNLFAAIQRWLPIVPLGGAHARFQPVWVQDVATAFRVALDDPETFACLYELAGPHVYTLAELVRIAGTYRAGGNGRPRPVWALPDAFARLHATFHEFAPGPTMVSRDNLDSMRVPNVASGDLPGLAELGIVPAPLEPEVSQYLARKSRRSHLDDLRRDAHP
jgi:uncharacterized protein YbjT (DUF2867 family)